MLIHSHYKDLLDNKLVLFALNNSLMADSLKYSLVPVIQKVYKECVVGRGGLYDRVSLSKNRINIINA